MCKGERERERRGEVERERLRFNYEYHYTLIIDNEGHAVQGVLGLSINVI